MSLSCTGGGRKRSILMQPARSNSVQPFCNLETGEAAASLPWGFLAPGSVWISSRDPSLFYPPVLLSSLVDSELACTYSVGPMDHNASTHLSSCLTLSTWHIPFQHTFKCFVGLGPGCAAACLHSHPTCASYQKGPVQISWDLWPCVDEPPMRELAEFKKKNQSAALCSNMDSAIPPSTKSHNTKQTAWVERGFLFI